MNWNDIILGFVGGFVAGIACCIFLLSWAFDRPARFEHEQVGGVTRTRKRRWPRLL